MKKCNLTFKKMSSWTSFIHVHGRPDPVQIKARMKMTQDAPDIDPVSFADLHILIHSYTYAYPLPLPLLLHPYQLLSLSSHCTHLHHMQRALYALRQHSVTICEHSPITSLPVPTNSTPQDVNLIWNSIYSGLDSRK